MRVTLTVVEGPHAGRAFSFDEHDTFFVGRSVRAHFSLPKKDRSVSRMHFLFEVNPPFVRVVDLGSRNGTIVNDERVQAADLRHGDRIRAGRSVLEIAIQDASTDEQTLSTAQGERAGVLVELFEKEMRAARGPRIEHFVAKTKIADRPALLWELVMLELEIRLLAKDPVRVEDYLKRFPELKDNTGKLADLVVAECTFRRRVEPTLCAEEYVRRFPALVEGFADRLLAHQSEAETMLRPARGRPAPPGWPRIPGYDLKEVVGQGGMGVVYRAVSLADGRQVAVKTIKPAIAAGAVTVERFLREADILRRLNHRHIVAFRALGEVDGLLWFAMDLVPGTNAARLVAQEGPLDIARAIRLMLPVLGALTYAHAEGFVHRDIKPGNILITPQSVGEEARLADFGLARTYQASRLSGLTFAGALAGTPVYMAPEQILSLRDAKPPADQYSVAATLYFLLTGHAPYDPETNVHAQLVQVLENDPIPLLKRRPGLPHLLGAMIRRAMSRASEDRYPDVAAFAAALELYAK